MEKKNDRGQIHLSQGPWKLLQSSISHNVRLDFLWFLMHLNPKIWDKLFLPPKIKVCPSILRKVFMEKYPKKGKNRQRPKKLQGKRQSRERVWTSKIFSFQTKQFSFLKRSCLTSKWSWKLQIFVFQNNAKKKMVHAYFDLDPCDYK